MDNPQKYLDDLLVTAAQSNASDIHLSPSTYPTIRVDGRLVALTNLEILSKDSLNQIIPTLLGPERQARFATEKEIDFAFEMAGNRFRANAYQSRGAYAATLRLIPKQIKTLEEL